MEAIKEALTFDDVLLLPRFSKVLPSMGIETTSEKDYML